MHAYTREYPIPPIKPAVIVVASKLEKNLTNPGRKSVQISQGKNAARYNTLIQIWDPNLGLSALSRIDIPPGESEILDLAVRCDEDEDAIGWNNESYNPPLWKNPRWKLQKGRYLVSVTVRSAGQRWAADFDLNNQISRGEFLLTPRVS